MTTASICTIGDEILIGQIVDTNSSKISQALNALGIKIRYMLSVGDDRDEIINNIDKCLRDSNIVIVTGGLGPTKDDITKEALGALTGATGTYTSNEQLDIIRSILNNRGIEMLDVNRAQADVPNSCNVIPNRLGTAPIMEFIIEESKYGHTAALYSLPGVPFEAIGALEDVMTSISKHFGTQKIEHRTICTYGIPESLLAKQIEVWEDNLPEYLHLAYLPNPILGVRLRLSCYGANDRERINRMDCEIEALKSILGNAIYGTGDDSIQSIIPKLLKNGETLSIAESCTGGLLSSLITSVPGSSTYYKGSVTSYSNEIKERVLGVQREILDNYGAVSKECVEAMAIGVLKLMDTDYSIATSGIAGPGGATTNKPVGLCWMAVAHRNRTTGIISVETHSINCASNREINIQRFASNALNYLRILLLHLS